MKFNFKKISAVLASGVMTVSGMAFAAAANYPAPFVVGSTADVAIVYGTGAGVSSLDMVQAGNIQSDLQTKMGTVGGTTTVTGGDAYKFEKTSTKFHLGDTITGVIASALDEDELPSLLGDGKYLDNDNDEIDYTQKITMAASQLVMFEDNDYKEDEPTVGFKISSGSTVMTYQLAFSDTLLLSDMPTTDLPIMGKEYYVLSNTTDTMTLLDSATETILSEGGTATVGGKTVSIEYVSTSEVKLNVDGEVTNTLNELDTFKLNDGSYVGIKDIMYDAKEAGISKVEFSLGSGKLKLTDGDIEVQINDETISGLESDFDLTNDVISNIELAWKADDDLFVTEDSVITMPGFEVVSLSFGGLNYPAEEMIEVKQGGDKYAVLENFPLKDGVADINFLYATTAGTFAGLGKDADNQLVTAATGASLSFDKDTDDYFVVSWSDGSDAESYLARFTNFVLDGSDNKTDFQYYKDGVWTDKKTGAKDADTISLGNAEIVISAVNRLDKTLTVGNNSANTNFHTLYSKEGMTVYLPYEAANDSVSEGAINLTDSTTIGHNSTSFYLVMKEEDKNGNKAHADGDWINMTIGWDSSSTAEVEVSAVDDENSDVSPIEIDDTDVWRGFTYSALATEILYNKPSSGQRSVKLMYHGDEVAADVFVTSADAVVTTGGVSALGEVLVKDSEVSSVSTKNLVIVGGSCINSAAASVLGGTYCGAAFTSATGVGSGQFLIKGVSGSTVTSKLALVVAGYDAADTVNAATYLRTQDVDTGMEYKGTSSTTATLVTTTA